MSKRGRSSGSRRRAYARPTGVDIACLLPRGEMGKEKMLNEVVYINNSITGGQPVITFTSTGGNTPLGVLITVPTRPAKKVTHINCIVAVSGLVKCDSKKLESSGLRFTGLPNGDALLHGGVTNTSRSISFQSVTLTSKTPRYNPLASPNNFDIVCDVSRKYVQANSVINAGDIMVQVELGKPRARVASLSWVLNADGTMSVGDYRIIGVSLTHVTLPKNYKTKNTQAAMRIPVRIGGCVTINETNRYLGQGWKLGETWIEQDFFMKILGWKRKDSNNNYVGGLVAHIGTMARGV